MKQIEFKTSKGEFVAVELYDKIDKTSLSLDNGFLTYRDHIGWDGIRIMDSDCINLGCILDITEEQSKDVVDEYDDGYFYYPDGYKDTCDSALESLHSLLQANEVYFENHIPPFIERFDEYKEAQSKVWDKPQTYLFKKI